MVKSTSYLDSHPQLVSTSSTLTAMVMVSQMRWMLSRAILVKQWTVTGMVLVTTRMNSQMRLTNRSIQTVTASETIPTCSHPMVTRPSIRMVMVTVTIPMASMVMPIHWMPHNGLIQTRTAMATIQPVQHPTVAQQSMDSPQKIATVALIATLMVTPILMTPGRHRKALMLYHPMEHNGWMVTETATVTTHLETIQTSARPKLVLLHERGCLIQKTLSKIQNCHRTDAKTKMVMVGRMHQNRWEWTTIRTSTWISIVIRLV